MFCAKAISTYFLFDFFEDIFLVEDSSIGSVDEKNSSVSSDSDVSALRMRLPDRSKHEMFAVVKQLVGGSRVKVICEDGVSRLARIPGKMKRFARVRDGDLLIVVGWDIQKDKADVLFRYSRTEAMTLKSRGLIPKEIDVF